MYKVTLNVMVLDQRTPIKTSLVTNIRVDNIRVANIRVANIRVANIRVANIMVWELQKLILMRIYHNWDRFAPELFIKQLFSSLELKHCLYFICSKQSEILHKLWIKTFFLLQEGLF